jgi:hypothetical protein
MVMLQRFLVLYKGVIFLCKKGVINHLEVNGFIVYPSSMPVRSLLPKVGCRRGEERFR